MKLLFVHDNVYLTHNGSVYSNAFPYTTLKRYADVFSEVTVVARSKAVASADGMPLAEGEGVRFVFLESIASLRSFFGLRQRHRRTMADLVTAHDAVIVRLPSEFGAMAAQEAFRLRRSYLAEVVGCAWDALWHYGKWRARLYALPAFMKMRRAVRRADYVSYVTQHFLQKRYPASHHAKHVGVSDVELPGLLETTLVRRLERIESPKEKIVLGTIANLDMKYKGLETAVRALAETEAAGVTLHYRILGEGDPGPYRRLAERLGVADRVFFDAPLPPGGAVHAWLDGIDVYLQPSLTEGLPRSLAEAMGRGCPAVGSTAGGIPELLEKRMLFDHKKPGELAPLLGGLIGSKALMKAAAARNFREARRYEQSVLDGKRRAFLAAYRDAMLSKAR